MTYTLDPRRGDIEGSTQLAFGQHPRAVRSRTDYQHGRASELGPLLPLRGFQGDP